MKRLIVNADDYGHTRGVSQGIRRAHREGVVTSTTAMMNLPGVETDLRAALAECRTLGLGVHLNLTGGAPVLAPEQITSITRLGGGQGFPSQADLRSGASRLAAEEVKAEWTAQVERFVELTGRAPTHLDSHHHTSYLTPALFGTMLELAREYGCAIRCPLAAGVSPELAAGQEFEALRHFLHPMLLAATDVPHPDHFWAGFYAAGATREGLLAWLERLPEGTSELMCHPGVNDGDLQATSSYSRQREQELAVLTDPAVRERMQQLEIELISFRDLH